MNHPGLCEDCHSAPPALPRHARRLPDKVLVAFYAACAQHNVEVAWRLLVCLETMMGRSAERSGRRGQQNRENLVAAHEWLWRQRHLALDRSIDNGNLMTAARQG
jgi:hypothetical protein